MTVMQLTREGLKTVYRRGRRHEKEDWKKRPSGVSDAVKQPIRAFPAFPSRVLSSTAYVSLK